MTCQHPNGTYFCKDCGDEACEKCAGRWEEDYDCVGDPARYVWCGLVLCENCAAEREGQ